jgi:lipoprotein-anchoring transpeptidase ErfK/SrfK
MPALSRPADHNPIFRRTQMYRLATFALAATSLLATAGLSQAALWPDLVDPQARYPLMDEAESAQSAPIAREVVEFDGRHAPGTIVVSTSERRLYFVLGNGQAIRYGIGVGRPGFEWSGIKAITAKQEWPAWTPPAEMLRRRPDLPRHMAGGIENPLGARALYLGSSLYRIHGSNEPDSIGQAVSSGCIRMLNEDVVDLYRRVSVGTKVVVLR